MRRSIADEPTLSIESTIEAVDRLEKIVNDLCVYTRRHDQYPFDTVTGEMLAKAFALSRSAILLVQNGYPYEAFGLCRSLYESAIYLRYITRVREKIDERSMEFLHFGVTSKAFWFELLDQSSSLTQEEKQDVHRYKNENGIPDDPKRITQPWSGVRKLIERTSREPHPIDRDDSTEALREKQRAIAYTDTSSYVHCTQPGLNNYTYEWREPILIGTVRSSENSPAQKTCLLINTHLIEIVRYCLFGMNVLSKKDFDLAVNSPDATNITS